jgi:excisionase family DNA binding protein
MLPGLVTITEAARILGVSAPTLRRWDRAGKLKTHRHPINGYRLYSLKALHNLAKRIRAAR